MTNSNERISKWPMLVAVLAVAGPPLARVALAVALTLAVQYGLLPAAVRDRCLEAAAEGLLGW